MDTTEPEDFVRVVRAIAPHFRRINLDDIRAPDCFWIEQRLREELDIPVFHDDQHGTATIAGGSPAQRFGAGGLFTDSTVNIDPPRRSWRRSPSWPRTRRGSSTWSRGRP